MSQDDLLRTLMREAVIEGLHASRHVIREELRAAMGELGTTAAPGDDETEVETKQAAKLAHVGVRTINAWKRAGLLTPVKRGKSDVYRAGDVLAVAANRKAPRKILDMRTEATRILARRKSKEES